MTHLLPLLVLMAGCRSCAERRAEREAEEEAALVDELQRTMAVDVLVVVTEQVDREDGGVEAWGENENRVELTAPAGWTITWSYSPPSWLSDDCPDDVPLVSYERVVETLSNTLPAGSADGLKAWAGGCDLDGADLRGTYDAGYTIAINAEGDDGEVISFALPIEVELTIE